MNAPLADPIRQAEARLRQAMLDSDLAALDALLADDLVFISHLGQRLGKADDLAAHRGGAVVIDELTPSEETVALHGHAAVVTVRVRVAGSFGGAPASGDFRFTRVWARAADGAWRVVAAHSTLVA